MLAATDRKQHIPNELRFLAPIIVDDLVRVGGHNDGGYIIPRAALKETEVLLSLGVNEDWSFDADFLRINPKAIVHAYDPTISDRHFKKQIIKRFIYLCCAKSSIKDVIAAVRLRSSYKRFFNGLARHYEERVHNRIDTAKDATFESMFRRAENKKSFVKMDIEGSEYRVIDALVKYSSRVIGIVIEFHDTEPLRAVFCTAVKKLQEHYDIVHIHGNNWAPVGFDGFPEVVEITFLRKGFHGTVGAKRRILPLEKLDEPNDPKRADYALRFT
jgi:FkbM family methyltransferase